ncbi:MAG TPA: protein phosphatase CheZ [Rhodocyclaceae bacterium]|nr:protein phosphatase CheZ [Rhodocyclaceae bacterium]
MNKPVKLDESGDSDDLQALFDSIAADGASPAPPPVVPAKRDAAGDNDELQALFDTVAAQVTDGTDVEAPQGPVSPQEAVFNKLGHMARQLHDNMRELGYDRMLEETARQIPDARQRLSYIAQMTEQAASRVLNATDIAKPLQDQLLEKSEGLASRWDRMFANQLSVDEFKALAADTRAYFKEAPGKIRTTSDQLMEIMMAQDFQDLTGQVIKKVVEMAQSLESQLVGVLIEAIPEDRKAEAPEGLMNGPVIDAAGRADVVTNQAQVDDLLESLGF